MMSTAVNDVEFPFHQMKRQRRNAIKPLSIEADILRDFSMNYQMTAFQIVDENTSSTESKSSAEEGKDSEDDEDHCNHKKDSALNQIFPAVDIDNAPARNAPSRRKSVMMPVGDWK
jgi:hypothetical protein